MANRFGNLGDFFPATEVKCRVRGCENKIHVSGEEVIQKLASGKSGRPEKMCDECYARLKTLEDKEMPCSTPGCEGTFVWNRYQQLEAHVRSKGGEVSAPHGLCPACQESVKSLPDQERPCRLRGCKNTWTWTAREQQESGGKAPAPRLCNECFKIYRDLKDDYVPCRIKGCVNSVQWTKYQQLEHIRAGKSLDNPPPRMCEDCFKLFSTLKNEERACKINGCKNTWVLTAYDQLEIIRNTPEGEEPAMPARMCKECFDFYTTAKDIEVPCRNRGCKNTWVWTRSMQLGARLRGIKRPQVKLCDECVKALMLLHDEERPCNVPGCTGTWTYRAEDQLRDKCAAREEPKRRCASCHEFLQTQKPEVLTCGSCGKEFNWSVQEQLACKLGEFVKPEKCPDCVRSEIAGLAPADPSTLVVSRPQIRIPTSGDWNMDEAIRDWPVRMDRDAIGKMENSQVRVVCIGDSATVSVDTKDQDWPSLLEGKLQERFGECGKVGVLNVGIKGCTTAQGLARIQRDVVPFKPQLVVFSFVLGDSRLGLNDIKDAEEQEARLSKLAADFDEFVGKLKGEQCTLLCWLPNPLFPQECEDGRFDQEQFKSWCERQSMFFDLVQGVVRKGCERHGIQLVDARSLFEVNGAKSAQKWMSDWCNHNEQGAMNIANWLMDRIVSAKLTDVEALAAEKVEAEDASAAEPVAEAVVVAAVETAVVEDTPASEVQESAVVEEAPAVETQEPVAETAGVAEAQETPAETVEETDVKDSANTNNG